VNDPNKGALFKGAPFEFESMSKLPSIPRLEQVLGLLENMAPANLAEPWDNPGLQVGSYSSPIKKILLSLDPTMKALMAASRAQAQLLLTHHPLIFKPLTRMDVESFPGNVILEAAKKSISVVAVHTNLDAARGGMNDILAEIMGLEDVEAFGGREGEEDSGLGRIGYLSEPASMQALAERVRTLLGTRNLRVTIPKEGPIRRIAIVGGSGGSMIPLASEKGADLLLTGDVGHHHALEAKSRGMALLDGGHFCMEKKAFNAFCPHFRERLAEQGWDVVVEVDDDESDPLEAI